MLPRCSSRTRRLTVGSLSATRNVVIAEIYAAELARAGIPVDRRSGYSDAKALMTALQRSEIDVFAGYVAARRDGTALLESERSWYENRLGVTWLESTPAKEGPCLLTSSISAERFWLVTLSRCARIASQLRLAATSDFVARAGELEKLRSCYGGFRFKSVVVCDRGDQYNVLNRDDADIANGFSTAPEVVERSFGVLADKMNCLPVYTIAPVLRTRTMRAQPRIAFLLDRITATLNQYAVQRINMQCDLGGLTPRFVAEEFVMAAQPRRRATPNRAASP